MPYNRNQEKTVARRSPTQLPRQDMRVYFFSLNKFVHRSRAIRTMVKNENSEQQKEKTKNYVSPPVLHLHVIRYQSESMISLWA